jgi:UDP:flavonoid glycosyltransferase YjiC (YdhE family)
MDIVFYISGHGFGHATRDLEVIRCIQEQRPDVRVVIRSSVPQWFVERSAIGTIAFQSCETDTGVAQIDSLQLDESETVRRAAAFYNDFPARVESEAHVLETLGASVVVGDVPPLAFAAAARAGVPSIAFANFTWDWIYEAYPKFDASTPDVMATIRKAYARASLALRLPFAGGFEPMRAVTRDVPLVARHSHRGRDETRNILGLADHRPIVLASFGGHGASMPFADIAQKNNVTIILTDYEAAEGQSGATLDGRLRRFTREVLDRQDVRYEDLVAAADVVVSKPGYGIVSECIANRAALLYTSRGHFAEQNVIVTEMKRVLRCRFITQEDLRAGRWDAAIESLLGQPLPPEQMASAGAAGVASTILEMAEDSRSI